MSATRREHSAVFFSPGTFFPETTRRPVESWDPALAVPLAQAIVERYDSRPHSFRFETHIVSDPVSDGAGGETQGGAEARGVLRALLPGRPAPDRRRRSRLATTRRRRSFASNMRSAGGDSAIVVVNTNSFRSVIAFGPGDFLVDTNGTIVERGDDPKHVAYRAARGSK